MKNLYLSLFFISMSSLLVAQIAVTLQVDMSNEIVSADGVHVAGNFQDWLPATTSLTDDNDDGIWEAIVPLDTAGLEGVLIFKFINGNEWTNPNENITDEACSDGFGNRLLAISDQNMVLFGDVETGGAPCYNKLST